MNRFALYVCTRRGGVPTQLAPPAYHVAASWPDSTASADESVRPAGAHAIATLARSAPYVWRTANRFSFSTIQDAGFQASAQSVIPSGRRLPRKRWHNARAGSRGTRGITPATLPTLGLLDQLAAAGTLQSKRFTAIGYGLQNRVVGGGQPFFQDSNPIPRMDALSSFSAPGSAALRLSQNPATGDGGTCYGDSGGPTSSMSEAK